MREGRIKNQSKTDRGRIYMKNGLNHKDSLTAVGNLGISIVQAAFEMRHIWSGIEKGENVMKAMQAIAKKWNIDQAWIDREVEYYNANNRCPV